MGKKAREKAGKKAATVGIVGNIFLTVFNLVVGFYSGSYALISEGAHTISDITTSVISYAGFVVGSKPADRETWQSRSCCRIDNCGFPVNCRF